MARGRPKQFDPDAALEVAIQVFWDRGYDEAALAEVMQRSGVGKQSLYDTFGSKRELFQAAIEHYARDSEDEWRALLSEHDSPLANLRAFVARWTTCPADIHGRGCMMVSSINSLAHRDDEFSELASAHVERQRQVLESTFRAAKSAGELDASVGAADMASKWMTFVMGSATIAKLDGHLKQVEASARAILAELDSLATEPERG